LDYEVRVKGSATADLDIDLASRQFSKVFKTDLAKAHRIITSEKAITLKKNLSLEQAEKMLAVLSKIGLKAAIYPKPVEAADLSIVAEPELDKPTELSLAAQPDIEAPSAPQQEGATHTASSPNTKRVRAEETETIEDQDDDELPEINTVPVSNGLTWISAGFTLMKQHPFAWIIASTVAILINGAVSAIPEAGPFLSMAIWPVLFGGLMVGAHKQAEGQPFSGFSFLNGLSAQPIQLMLVGVAYLLFYGLLVVAMLGFFMLMGDDVSTTTIFIVVTSASFPPMMILFFAPTLVAVNNLSAYQACKLSLMGGLRNALPFILFNVGLIFILILGAIALGVGILVSLPIAVASMYAAYCDIFD
jgi:hypothetical protein